MSCCLSERNVRGMGWPRVVGGLGPGEGGGGYSFCVVCLFHFEGVWMEMGGRVQTLARRSVRGM